MEIQLETLNRKSVEYT